jgi:hypothetical protein
VIKLAVLSESSADEAAIRILVDGLHGTATEPVEIPPLRTRGWPSALVILPTVIKHLFYQTDADALAVVVDSDRTPIHASGHEKPGGTSNKCRLCQVRECANLTLNQIRSRPGGRPLKVAVGLAAPCIEAWYRCGRDPHVTEANWSVALQSKQYPYDCKRLKEAVYGTDRASLETERRAAVVEAQRLAQNPAELEKWFPNGFGPFAREVRLWQMLQKP